MHGSIAMSKMMQSGLVERYMDQIAGCRAVLEKVDVACVASVWDVIRLSGRALPQEIFLKKEKSIHSPADSIAR
jgi:hypothetical protein